MLLYRTHMLAQFCYQMINIDWNLYCWHLDDKSTQTFGHCVSYQIDDLGINIIAQSNKPQLFLIRWIHVWDFKLLVFALNKLYIICLDLRVSFSLSLYTDHQMGMRQPEMVQPTVGQQVCVYVHACVYVCCVGMHMGRVVLICDPCGEEFDRLTLVCGGTSVWRSICPLTPHLTFL